MKPVLVMQLARFGDLIQTKRLVRGLQAKGLGVHLLVDASLARLAALVYPGVTVHTVNSHSQPDPMALKSTLAALAEVRFHRVYNLNFAGMSLAVSALFDPDAVRGYRLDAGQPVRDPWAAMAFRWTKNRRQAAVNLADFWAGFSLPMADTAGVNPNAAPKGGGLGVAMAGRSARRSLPPEVLASVVQAMVPVAKTPKIYLLGTAAERACARELTVRLPARVAEMVVDLTGRTGWDELADVVSGLDRVLTPDTGIMHLAAHLGVPVTATFLSSAWCHETGPYGAGHTVWQAVLPCTPCLESAPCPCGQACLEPFKRREFLRLVAEKAKGDPPAGMIGFRTELDALGVVCKAFTGTDAGAAERARVRSFLCRHLGIEAGQTASPAPDLAERLVEEPDFMLDKPQGLREHL
ncbi:glycosyltransferase family 9 protein [Fundidesulfovibrio terrae]|uniref:glycosyltransferase family 9 protein n=1 Tax=Fundidesulfovibrio terrae TaxID=2922866 RepID=UPI001FAF59DA|nr:glycosyltransferase family 9 protein [Fundidesulfovibrio terrae]